MRLHAFLPTETPDADPNDVVRLGVRAEEMGYAGVWLPDHPLPYYEFRDYFGGVFEPLAMLANLAAVTTRIRLGTGVLVPAMRNPFIVAKQAATIDALSRGRLDLGIGVGIVLKEFRNVGADFHNRGKRTDEMIHLLRHLFRVGRGPFDGRYYGLGEEAVFAPHPPQGDRMPIWIGGRTDAAWRRAARLGYGWLCAMTEPDVFAANVTRMRELAERPVLAGARIEVTGDVTVDQAARAIEVWQAAAADDLFVWFGAPAGYESRMAVFAEALSLVSAPGG